MNGNCHWKPIDHECQSLLMLGHDTWSSVGAGGTGDRRMGSQLPKPPYGCALFRQAAFVHRVAAPKSVSAQRA